MGSPLALHLANGWLSQFENLIKDDAKIYERYMDDNLRKIKRSRVEQKLEELDNIHKNLQFILEMEVDHNLSFLDMRLIYEHETDKLSSTWYFKPSDTGLIMNYHALAPKWYKRSGISGFVYRIYRAYSSSQNFHDSLGKAKCILEKNQYPPSFYDPIIKQTLDSIIGEVQHPTEKSSIQSNTRSGKVALFIQYRGKCTEDYAHALHKTNAPCTIIMTLRKLKTVLPSLKPPVEKMLKSGLVYCLKCPRCSACYVGETSRHLKFCIREHIQRAGPMKSQ